MHSPRRHPPVEWNDRIGMLGRSNQTLAEWG
jgi:hypothetical protein